MALIDYAQAPALCLKARGAGSQVLNLGTELAGAGTAQLTWTYWLSAGVLAAGSGIVLVVWEVISPEHFPLDEYLRGVFSSGWMVEAEAFVVNERQPVDTVLATIGEARHDYVRAIEEEVRDGLLQEGERIAKQRAGRNDRFARALRGELNTPLGEAMRRGSEDAARAVARRHKADDESDPEIKGGAS